MIDWVKITVGWLVTLYRGLFTEKCPRCRADGRPAMIYGLPHFFCANKNCITLWGLSTLITGLLPVVVITLYPPGAYWRTLYRLLTGTLEDQ